MGRSSSGPESRIAPKSPVTLRGMDAAQMTNSILHVCEGDRKQASNRIAAGVAAPVHACVVLGLGRTEDVSEDWACGILASDDWTTRLRRK